MNFINRYLAVLGVLLITNVFNSVIAQDLSKKELKLGAVYYFDREEYQEASRYYKQLVDLYPKKLEYKYRLGICYFESPVYGDQAPIIFESIKKEYPDYKEIDFYLASSYMATNRFDEAINAFKEVKKDAENVALIKIVDRLIENCENGKILVANPVDVTIENIGSNINTIDEEYAPVITSDESVLIFTYRGDKSSGGLQNSFFEPDPTGQFYEDVYIAEKIGDRWSVPKSISNEINTHKHDASVALSSDGQTLFLYKNEGGKDGENGQIYYSELNGVAWSEPQPLNKNINSKYWEGSVSLSPDNKTLYFSSNRPEGLGGKDLYKSTWDNEINDWGTPENLGNMINTEYDEDAPFIHPDGIDLYFSSEGHNSMGAYDIFKAELNDQGIWEKSVNIGYPINTTEDDIHYVVSASGKHGYYSSSRKDGFGNDDIYVVTPGFIDETNKVALMQITGVVTGNDSGTYANITVYEQPDNNIIGKFHSNAATGKYIINLPPGKDYKLEFEKPGYPLFVNYINTTGVDEYTETNINVPLYNEKVENLVEEKKNVKEDMIKKSAKESRTRLSYEEFISKYGQNRYQAIHFVIQIGAYNNAANFSYPDMSSIGKIKVVEEGDLSRFQVGKYDNLKEANINRDKAVALGISDAFIIVIYNGEKISIDEAYEKGLLDI